MNSFFIFGAKYLYLLVPLIAMVHFLWQSKETQKKMLIFAIIALPLAYLVAKFVGYFYYDPRPFVQGNFIPLIPHAPDNGFPSDHMLFVSAIAATWWYFNRRISFVLWTIATLVGISRIGVGVHHPIDIIGSVVIAMLCAAITPKIIHFFHNHIKSNPAKSN
jgi:undecaprenyl-diphosphatase